MKFKKKAGKAENINCHGKNENILFTIPLLYENSRETQIMVGIRTLKL